MTAINIILPTVDGREEIFEQVWEAYARTPNSDITVIRNAPTVGYAWQLGAEKTKGAFLHFANDDCVPDDGWYTAAIEAISAGGIPSACMRTPGGELQSLPVWGAQTPDWTRVHCCLIPFMSRHQWDQRIGPMFTGHYHTDNWVSWRAEQAGWPTFHRCGYAFTHYWAQAGRGAGMPEGARMSHDEANYEAAKRMALAGKWTQAWPQNVVTRD